MFVLIIQKLAQSVAQNTLNHYKIKGEKTTQRTYVLPF